MEPVFRISDRAALTITIEGLSEEHAAALRDAALSLDCGVSVSSVDSAKAKSPSDRPAPLAGKGHGETVVLTGPSDGLRRLSSHLYTKAGLHKNITGKFESLLDNYLRSDYKIDCKARTLDLGSRTHVMGVLNATPDSFSDGGLYADMNAALARAREMAAQGADIIDVGGESTRPGSEPVSAEEELRRIIPVIETVSKEIGVPVSVDTYKSSVARKALEAGASIVNDISGLRFSPDMANVAADYGAAVVIMHIKGTPRDMQQNPVYADVVGEIIDYLEQGVEIALRAGVDGEKILIDPGIGFGKTQEHNIEILNRLDEFRSLGRPIVLGTSRKRFIGAVLGIQDPSQRVEGTAATVALGIERGARVVRVHDVAHMVRVARMTDAIIYAQQLQ